MFMKMMKRVELQYCVLSLGHVPHRIHLKGQFVIVAGEMFWNAEVQPVCMEVL